MIEMGATTSMRGVETVAPLTGTGMYPADEPFSGAPYWQSRPTHPTRVTDTVVLRDRWYTRGGSETTSVAVILFGSVDVPPVSTIRPLRTALADFIDVREPQAVTGYLKRHPEVVPTLRQAKGEILKCFPTDVRLGLDLLEDPESDDVELFIVVRSSLSAEQAAKAMDHLLEDWFIDQAPVRSGHLGIVDEPLAKTG